jgi:hypothetical protein
MFVPRQHTKDGGHHADVGHAGEDEAGADEGGGEEEEAGKCEGEQKGEENEGAGGDADLAFYRPGAARPGAALVKEKGFAGGVPCVDASGKDGEVVEAEGGEGVVSLLCAAAALADEGEGGGAIPGGGGGGEGVEGNEFRAFDVAGGELGELADIDEA